MPNSAPTAKKPTPTSAAASCSAKPRTTPSRSPPINRAGNTRTDSAHNRYNIAPMELVKIQREARKAGLDIVGFYHSHPDHPAQYSPHRLRRSPLVRLRLRHHRRRKRGASKITNSFLLTGTGEEDKAFTNQPVEVQ